MIASFANAVRALLIGAAALALPCTAAPAAAPIPVADFFANPTFSAAVLSPNAKYLAVRFGADNERDRLAVVDLVKNTVKVVGQLSTADVADFQWVNNDRLVFDTTDKLAEPGKARGSAGMFAVDRDGSHKRPLGDERNFSLAAHPGPQDSNTIYVTQAESYKRELTHVNLVRLDTVTGQVQTVQRPGESNEWVLDNKGEPRLTTILDKNQQSLHYRDPVTNAWRKIASFEYYVSPEATITPVGFAHDGTLYVAYSGAGDKAALHTFDLKTNSINPTPVVALADFDFKGTLITDQQKLLGIRYHSDAWATIWLDDKMKATQARIDALLPDTVNLVTLAARPEMPWVLVESYSDRQPSQYALFNLDTGKLNPVGESRARIKPAAMGEQEIVRIKARDGMLVPAWLSLPNGSDRKNLPLVVLVHGGPYLRGVEWGWKGDRQFLASRGYAVIEPEFRGSMGYGNKLYKAGWQQWGLTMQDDIADVTRWAIAQGIADPKRICIAGASYGGYATLMGLVNDPELYQCGVEWVGVSDLELLSTWNVTSDMQSSYKQYGMPTLIGDPARDAVRFKATSPLHQAARIKRPLLMAYGAMDRRVPLEQGRKFYDAVKLTNPGAELVIYDDEGHGWFYMKNRIDFWTRVEKFLGQHIGKP